MIHKVHIVFISHTISSYCLYKGLLGTGWAVRRYCTVHRVQYTTSSTRLDVTHSRQLLVQHAQMLIRDGGGDLLL